MSELTTHDRRAIKDFLASLSDEPKAVILVGSFVRGASLPDSDIDLLVLDAKERPHSRGRVQAMYATRAELASRLAAGDDFAAWILRFGKPIVGRRRWNDILKSFHGDNQWPSAERKYVQARRHCKVAQELVSIGDDEGGLEESRVALAHLARGLLLSHGVFPLSRPELGDQLRTAGHEVLAEAMDRESSAEAILAVLGDELTERANVDSREEGV